MKSKIVIEIETEDLKPFVYDGEDLAKEQEKALHDAVFDYFDSKLQDEEFEQETLEFMSEGEYFNNLKSLSDIGSVSVTIMRE